MENINKIFFRKSNNNTKSIQKNYIKKQIKKYKKIK